MKKALTRNRLPADFLFSRTNYMMRWRPYLLLRDGSGHTSGGCEFLFQPRNRLDVACETFIAPSGVCGNERACHFKHKVASLADHIRGEGRARKGRPLRDGDLRLADFETVEDAHRTLCSNSLALVNSPVFFSSRKVVNLHGSSRRIFRWALNGAHTGCGAVFYVYPTLDYAASHR